MAWCLATYSILSKYSFYSHDITSAAVMVIVIISRLGALALVCSLPGGEEKPGAWDLAVPGTGAPLPQAALELPLVGREPQRLDGVCNPG